jgi:hypothetical protein
MSKRRKIILLALTLFALLTFSVTGLMMQVMGQWFEGARNPDIVLENGTETQVTSEDIQIGQRLIRMAEMPARVQLVTPSWVLAYAREG